MDIQKITTCTSEYDTVNGEILLTTVTNHKKRNGENTSNQTSIIISENYTKLNICTVQPIDANFHFFKNGIEVSEQQ